MAKDETKRIAPDILRADRDSLAALKSITDYNPPNQAFATAALDTSLTELDTSQRAETQAMAAAASARDDACAKEWAFHNKIIGMRDQVIAQYGRESNEAQAVGRKKPSERRTKTNKDGES